MSWSSLRITGRSGGASGPFMAGAVGAVNLTGRTRTAAAVQLAAYMDDAGPGSRRRSLSTPALPPGGAASAPPRPAEAATSGRQPVHNRSLPPLVVRNGHDRSRLSFEEGATSGGGAR
jgi:hypothetical protein